MEPQWFLSSNGKIFGPMSTGELEQMYRENIVQIDDLIRPVDSENWLPAAEVYQMFTQPPPAETPAAAAARLLDQSSRHFHSHDAETVSGFSPLGFLGDMLGRIFGGLWSVLGGLFTQPSAAETPSAAAARSLDQSSRQLRSHEAEAAAGFSPLGFLGDFFGGVMGQLFGGLWSVLAGVFGKVGNLFSAVTGVLPSWRSVLRSKVALAVLTIVILAIVFQNLEFTASDNQLVLDQLTALGEELEQMRGSEGVSPAEWSDFQQQSLETLEPALKLLNDSASRGHPLRRTLPLLSTKSDESFVRGSLLEAGHALRMLLKTQGANDEARNTFNRTMDAARQKLLPTAKPAPQQPAPESNDSIPGWILIMDGLLVVGALVFFGWRRLRK